MSPSASEVVRLFVERGMTLATVESCTGGMLGAAITEVAGSSAVYVGGWVTYANSMKVAQVGVAPELLRGDGPGAVSREAAEAMAAGGLHRSGADCCISITGIAGPDGGTPEKPVGTVWMALAAPGQDRPAARLLRLSGTRAEIRLESVRIALEWLLEHARGGI